jgi:hypothetical protein
MALSAFPASLTTSAVSPAGEESPVAVMPVNVAAKAAPAAIISRLISYY